MRKDIKKSYDNLKPSETDSQRMLNNILNESSVKSKKTISTYIKLGAIAACLIIAVLISIPLLSGIFVNDENIKTPINTPDSASLQDNTTSGDIAYKIILSINPDVEFSVDENDMIVEVIGLNEDGKKLIEGIEFAGLSFENATIIVVNQLIKHQYLSAYSIEKEIQLSFSQNSDMDALDIMSNIIETGADGYDLDLVTEKLDNDSLTIKIFNDGYKEIPIDKEDVTRILFDFTICEGYVDRANIIFNDDLEVSTFLDYAGFPTKGDIFYYYEELFDKGYIKDGIELEYNFTNISEDEFIEVTDLIKMLCDHHGINVEITTDIKSYTIYGLPVDIELAPVEVKYTLLEITTPTLIKTREDVTPDQLDILYFCFPEEEVDYFFIQRYYFIVPNLIGLNENDARTLCELAGYEPNIVYDEYDPNWKPKDFPMYNKENLCKVIYQDMTAVTTYESGFKIQINILMDEVDEEIIQTNDELLQTNNEGTIYEIYNKDIFSRIESIEFVWYQDETTFTKLDSVAIGNFTGLLNEIPFIETEKEQEYGIPYLTAHVYTDEGLSFEFDFIEESGKTIIVLNNEFVCYEYDLTNNLRQICFGNKPQVKDNSDVINNRTINDIYEDNFKKIECAVFRERDGQKIAMDIGDSFIDDFNNIMDEIKFRPIDIVYSYEDELYYITIQTEMDNYHLDIIDVDGEFAVVLNAQYISYNNKEINELLDKCFINGLQINLSNDEILDEFYYRIKHALTTAPDNIQAGSSFMPLEQVRVDRWDLDFVDIRGWHEVGIAYEDIIPILSAVLQPSPISAYRPIELVNVENTFIDTEFENNTDFRIALSYDDFLLNIFANHYTLCFTTRIHKEWYTAIMTNAALDGSEIYEYYIKLLGGKNIGLDFNDLTTTESISLFYVKERHKKDYPENGKLTEIIIDDRDVINDIVEAIQSNSEPIRTYPSRENADIVFHTPDGDIWAKIKDPFEMDTTENYDECTLIFDGYYWFDNSEFYEILIDAVSN